ncbi:ACT domain-containing protein, partial [Bacillus tropicus]
AVSGRSDSNKMATINMASSMRNLQHLKKVVERMKRVPEIYAVRSMMHK